MKYYNFDIVFQEIPGEVTLAVNITNCPNHCPGCHSPHLQEDIGETLDELTMDSILKRYGQSVTCVCLMGGDATPEEVQAMADHIRKTTPLKVAWYSGKQAVPDNFQHFDYVKVGPYKAEFGSLKEKTTNQRLLQNVNGQLVDITDKFWKR
ncbi:MAG: anaerobic ribonucleoside-triphosphate reductase activating protein [Bacteroidales bacterium]|nr:anaerobic ribonucleoside-triphosphate reductase activating protein [Bacteroidales bacterium]